MFNASLPGGGLASHGSEIPFVFGGSQSGAANQVLAQRIQTAWANFAKDPTSGPSPGSWPEYSPTTQSLANLGGEGGRDAITLMDPNVVDERCGVFWDAYDPGRPTALETERL
jgi:carboxylesterase type B